METGKFEKKSLKIITEQEDWKTLAKECVAFANAQGGTILIGIEDEEDLPPTNQKIPVELLEKIRKRISELTINVGINVNKEIAENGGEFIRIEVYPATTTIASTTDGRYFMRISDESRPILPEDLARLFNDKPAFIWETKVVQKVTLDKCDREKLNEFIKNIRKSTRVSDFVKQKSEEELLRYYHMMEGQYLTNLGILWIGTREQRAKLVYAPVVQFIKYDVNSNKVNKIVWDDYSLNPQELIEDIWKKIPDWKEGMEISQGILGRKFIPNYNENVIRELLANALAHRPYTTRGDIFINLYPDKLEIHNPGLLPAGVTPSNILHVTKRRNEHLCKIFYDLNIMEREGSGYDKMYEILLSEAKEPPIVEEKNDSVTVTVNNKVKDPEIVSIIEKLKNNYALNQREIICLGIILQRKIITAPEFSKKIQSYDDKQVKSWLGKLLKYEIVLTKGKTKGLRYYINPKVLQGTSYEKTDLSNIKDYRLKMLILEDLENYPNSRFSEIHKRIGIEIDARSVRKCLYELVKSGKILAKGPKKQRSYFINKNTEEKI